MRRKLVERELTTEGPRRRPGLAPRCRSVTVNLAESPLGWLHAHGHLDERLFLAGERLRGALEQLIPNHDDLFESTRGLGLMLGLKLKSDSRAFVAHLRDNHGLLTVAAGDNVVRVLPPLNIDDSHIAEFIEKLSAGAASYAPPES